MLHAKNTVLPVVLAIVCLAPTAQAGQRVPAGIPPVGSPAPRTPWGVLESSPVPHHSPRQWLGSARGHWDGDTLVVETTHFSGQAPWRGSGEDLTLVERFSRPDDRTLRYEVTFEDPDTWERPWTAALDMPRTNGLLYEYACHERNYGMENLLLGARALERAAATK